MGRSDTGPVARYLADLHARLAKNTDGNAADYIPELAEVDVDRFGIAIATADGEVYVAGDSEVPFTLQSLSKPFAYGYALHRHGRDVVREHVGVEPTGDAFNAILLDEENNRPFNPMVNAGAIAVCELFEGPTQDARRAAMRDFFSRFAGRDLALNDRVQQSEAESGHRNRAIAYMMLNAGMITRPPDEVLDIYVRQCSLEVTTRELAMMGATLANGGVHPLTGDRLLRPGEVRDVLSVMTTCGMYDFAGEWVFEVGIPAKSGISGGIVAVLPGQISIGIFSPPIDEHGHSVRGIAACREISREFGLHLLGEHEDPQAVILLEEAGDVVVLELQGPLYFGSVERLLRRVRALSDEVEELVLDFERVRDADAAAIRLLELLVASPDTERPRLVLRGLGKEQLGPLRAALEQTADRATVGFDGGAD